MEKEPTLNALCEKVTALEEKTKHLEEEITNLKKENEKLKSQQNSNTNIVPVTQGDKILFEVMSDIFYVSKYKLSKDFLRHIEQFGLSEDYQKELFNKFNSKIAIENVGGSAYRTLSRVLKKLGISDKFVWFNTDEDYQTNFRNLSDIRIDYNPEVKYLRTMSGIKEKSWDDMMSELSKNKGIQIIR